MESKKNVSRQARRREDREAGATSERAQSWVQGFPWVRVSVAMVIVAGGAKYILQDKREGTAVPEKKTAIVEPDRFGLSEVDEPPLPPVAESSDILSEKIKPQNAVFEYDSKGNITVKMLGVDEETKQEFLMLFQSFFEENREAFKAILQQEDDTDIVSFFYSSPTPLDRSIYRDSVGGSLALFFTNKKGTGRIVPLHELSWMSSNNQLFMDLSGILTDHFDYTKIPSIESFGFGEELEEKIKIPQRFSVELSLDGQQNPTTDIQSDELSSEDRSILEAALDRYFSSFDFTNGVGSVFVSFEYNPSGTGNLPYKTKTDVFYWDQLDIPPQKITRDVALILSQYYFLLPPRSPKNQGQPI